MDPTPALRKAHCAPKERTDQVVNLFPHPHHPFLHSCSLGIRCSGYIYHLAPVASQEHNPEFQVCKSLECQGAHKIYRGQPAELLSPPPRRLAQGEVRAYIRSCCSWGWPERLHREGEEEFWELTGQGGWGGQQWPCS